MPAQMAALQLRLFGFPVQIQPGFWLLAVLVSLSAPSWHYSLALIAIVAASVLVHELGHAIAARSFGQKPFIALHMMGGVTSWIPTREIGRTRSMIVTAAGPFSGFALGLLALALSHVTRAHPRDALTLSSILVWTVDYLCMANFIWSAINLLPVLPFDGGQLMALALGRERRLLASRLSLVFGLICAAGLWSIGYPLAAIVFGLGGVMSHLSMERQIAEEQAPSPEAVTQALARARQALDKGEYEQAEQLARVVEQVVSDQAVRPRAREVRLWAALLGGDLAFARSLLVELPADYPVDALLRAAIEEAEGDNYRAAERLEVARRAGDARPELAGALVRLLLKTGRAADAAALTEQILDLTDLDEARRVASEVRAQGQAAAADSLERAIERTAALAEPTGLATS